MKNLLVSVLLISLILSACGTQPAPTSEPAPPAVNAATFTPSHTPAPTSTATPTPSITPTATPTPHPMSIDGLRAMSFPGSDIVIERELTASVNYRRYYAYYYSEGLKIYALLTIPNGEMPAGGWPAIVFNHGYIPPDVYRTTERYIAYVDRLASSGYVVFRIDYRGHDQSEGQPTGAYGHPGYTIDVLSAVAALQNHPDVNPEKIGMWGHSMGGFLTLRAMVISGDVKAGVFWAGVVASYPDMICCWRRTGNYTPSPGSRGFGWRGGWTEQYGSPETNPEFWASVSANSYLDELSGPVQLHHGTNDVDVPYQFSVTLADEIEAVGGTVELYTYSNDNHNISNYFTTAMNRTIAFFDQYLKE